MRLMEYREKVRNRAGIASGDQFIPSSVIDDAVNQALEQIDAEYHWPWLEVTNTFTTVAGTDTYALPADYRATRSILLRNTGGNQRILYNVSPTQALAKSSTATGVPDAYGIIGNNIVFVETPDQEYTVTHLYYRQTIELVADDDEPLIPDQWHGSVVAAAAANIAMREELRGIKDACDQDVANWIRRMRNALRRSTGPVVPRVRRDGWI